MKMMNRRSIAEISSTVDERMIGTIEGDEDGPCIILLSGVHGNESAGVEAVTDVIEEIRGLQPKFRGKLFGIRSNLKALQQHVRYVDEDMNRLWYPAIIKNIKTTPADELQSSERREVKQLLQLLDEITFRSGPKIILADLHTFSAEGCMFSLTCPEKPQTELVSKLYSPMVFGIEETLRGTVLNYYQKKNMISFGLEGGQHDKESSRYNLKASVFVLLCAAGCLDAAQIPALEEYDDYLKSITKNLPRSTELVYQHIIEPGDDFKMRPGYKNFQRIEKGEWLATDREGKIEAEANGYILMPLYQAQGDDGFFIISDQDS
ncbi:MAG TPA: succinylglutamate desuccinylase/aspartoacylase family protein [Balneolaceae bacterium]|nr:succinylglutamate desuccinylase/aspartoacylase family protein [Balneolaceae bacterium]